MPSLFNQSGLHVSSVADLIAYWAVRTPEALAIVAPDRQPLSYGQLQIHLVAVGEQLRTLGVGRRDRLALVLPNGPEMAVAFVAVGAHAVCAPLNPAYRAPEYEFYLADLQATALLIQAGMDSPARAVARAQGLPVIELLPLPEAKAGMFTLTGPVHPCCIRLESAQPDDVALVLHTSGTTARPKLVPLTHANLCTSAHNIALSLALTPMDRCLNVMPLFHIHGLVGALLSSLAAGASVVCTPGFYAPQFFAWQESFRPTWYTAVPTMHQSILARAAQHREMTTRCPLRFIRSCSAPLPPSLLSELEHVFKVPVIEAYGMTEAAHQIASNPLPPQQRKAGSVGIATGAEVTVMDEAGRVLPPGAQGEIVIRGANVTPGYADNPEANAQAFVQTWFRTGDLGVVDLEGYVFLTGRLKEIINRGGEKIAPREIDEVLLQHPLVAQAVTFALPHPQLGEDVAAAVVLHTPGTATVQALQEFVAAHLAAFKVPRQIVFVDDLSKGATGKVQRVGLAEKLGLTAIEMALSGEAEAFAAPITPLEEKLAAIWAHALGIERASRHDDFFQAGGDSILATQFLLRVWDALHVEVPFPSFFACPTIAGLAQYIETAGHTTHTLLPPLQAVLRQGDLPLSFAQQRLWFLSQLDPDNPAYNRPIILRLTGRLDLAALTQSLNEIIRRHESLRTTFPAKEGQPVQHIAPVLTLNVSVVELQELPVAEREAEGRRLVDAETQRLFDLAHGPLVRATVLCLGAEEHVLLVVVHHIVFDAWSAAVFVRELTTLYEACTTGKPATLPQQPIQYVDFAVWQRQWLQGKALDTQLAYWKQRLHNAPPILELPTDWPRSTSQPFHGAQQSIMLSQPLSRAVKALSQRTGSTLFMTLLTAFKVLLQRYTGQDDIVVGTPIANRPRTEIEGLIGCFINTLVLRTDLAGNPAFLELLRQVRQMALEAYAHQDLPFEKLVEALQPERDLSRTPLFQVLFNMVNIEAQERRLSDLQMESLAVEEPAAKFDLTLYVRERHETLHLECVYNAALFRQERIREMLAQYQHLLAQAVVHPEHRIGRYSLVTPAAQQVLPAPGEPLAEPSQDLVASLFTQWAQRVPERMALSQGQHTWTYGALAARADGLARTLVAHGIARGDVVAVTGERSFGLIASVLGVLLSGGVLLPLDPHLPEPRQQLMLREAAATTLIYVGQSDQGETLCAPQLALDLLRVDAATGYPVNAELAVDPATISLPAITPDEAAYIFFTSGTTGVPKGVLGRHKGLSHFLCWQRDTFAVGPQDRVAQLTSLSFDPVLRDIFLPLTSGATLCLPTAPDLLDAEATLRWLEHERISLLHVVPSRAQFWLANIPPDMLLRALRRTFFAGEPLTDTLVRQWRATAPYSAVVNLYGPTETTLAKCFYPVPSEPSPGIQPAGLPLPQTQALVLAEDARLCGIGELGEIVLRTPFRSLGGCPRIKVDSLLIAS